MRPDQVDKLRDEVEAVSALFNFSDAPTVAGYIGDGRFTAAWEVLMTEADLHAGAGNARNSGQFEVAAARKSTERVRKR